MTDAKTINDWYEYLKQTKGLRFAKKYFQQVDNLIDPNDNTIIEYRMNGVVTNDNVFHALADMELKKWRIAFVVPIFDHPLNKLLK